MEELTWRKSSRSHDSGSCVEVAELPGAMAVRDSKHPQGGMIAVGPDTFHTFLRAVKAGDFDRP